MLNLPDLDLLHLFLVYELDFNRLFRQFLAINLLNMNDSWTGGLLDILDVLLWHLINTVKLQCALRLLEPLRVWVHRLGPTRYRGTLWQHRH